MIEYGYLVTGIGILTMMLGAGLLVRRLAKVPRAIRIRRRSR